MATVTEMASSLRKAGFRSGEGAGGWVARLSGCRTRSFSSMWIWRTPRGSLALDQLDEQAVIRLRVDERDHVPPSSQPRFLVDHFNALGSERVDGCGQVVDLVGDVMKSLASALEELRHGCVRPGRAQQLQVRISEPKHDLFDTLVGDELSVRHLEAPDLCVVGYGGVEVRDREGDMFDLVEHRRILCNRRFDALRSVMGLRGQAGRALHGLAHCR